MAETKVKFSYLINLKYFLANGLVGYALAKTLTSDEKAAAAMAAACALMGGVNNILTFAKMRGKVLEVATQAETEKKNEDC